MCRVTFTGQFWQRGCWWAAWRLHSPLGSAGLYFSVKSICDVIHEPVDEALGFDEEEGRREIPVAAF